MRCFSAKTNKDLGAGHTNSSLDQLETCKNVNTPNGICFLYVIAEGKIFKGGRKIMNRIAYSVIPVFNDLRYNGIPGIMINNRFPSNSYSKMRGAGPHITNFGITIFQV